MMTIDEVRAELAHLREVPARLRLERLMRDKGGLVDMLEGMLNGVPQHGWLEYRSRIQGEPIDETLPGAYGEHNGTQVSEYQKMIEAMEKPEPTCQDTWSEPQPVVDGTGYAAGLAEVKPVKRKRGRPARRVENGGEA